MHCIYEKIGNNAPIGTLFVNKKAPIKLLKIDSLTINNNKDEITTRLMSLMGKEMNINKGGSVDSLKEEYTFMEPAMKNYWTTFFPRLYKNENNDIVELFNIVDKQTRFFIQ